MRLPLIRTAAAVVTTVLLLAPAAAQETKDKGPTGVITAEQLGPLLEKLGLEPRTSGQNQIVSVTREDLTISIELTVRGETLWLLSSLADLRQPARVRPEALRRFLEENEQRHPTHFAYRPETNRLILYRPVENRYLTPARVLQEIETLHRAARETRPAWAPAALVLVEPPDTEAIKKERARFQGEWRIVGYEDSQAGKIPAEKFALAFFRFSGGEVTIVLPAGDRHQGRYWLDPTRNPPEIDFILPGQGTDLALYRLEGDTLTILTGRGSRPKALGAFDPKLHGAQIILKRSKR